MVEQVQDRPAPALPVAQRQADVRVAQSVLTEVAANSRHNCRLRALRFEVQPHLVRELDACAHFGGLELARLATLAGERAGREQQRGKESDQLAGHGYLLQWRALCSSERPSSLGT